MTADFTYLDLTQTSDYEIEATQLPSLVETLATSLAKERIALQAALPGNEIDAIRQSIHALKGFVPIFCKPALGQELIQLEALVRKESAGTLRPRLVKLLEMLAILEQEIKLWRKHFALNPQDPSLFPADLIEGLTLPW